MAGIRIFPGTVLAEHAKQDLGIANIGLEPVFYHSRTLTDYDKVAEAVSKKKNWIMPGCVISFIPIFRRSFAITALRAHSGRNWENVSYLRTRQEDRRPIISSVTAATTFTGVCFFIFMVLL